MKQEVNGTVILPPLVFPGETVLPNVSMRERGLLTSLKGGVLTEIDTNLVPHFCLLNIQDLFVNVNIQ